MVKGYLSTKDLCVRYRCSSRTVFRWRFRSEHPLPEPRIKQFGGCNLWAIDDLEAWEESFEKAA